MRVLVVSHGHPSFSIGGAELASHNLFGGLNAIDGCEAYYLARVCPPLQRHGDSPLMSLRHGARESFLYSDDYDHFWLSNRNLGELREALTRYLGHVRPDVVHLHHVLGLGLETLYVVRRALPDAAIVVTFHEYLSICLNHGQMVKAHDNRLCTRASPADCAMCMSGHGPAQVFKRELFVKNHLGLADAYVSPSRFLIDRYVAWGLPRAKFHFIENGLDAAEPAAPRSGGRRARFGFFGQISAFKGLHVLLDAVGRVPDAAWGEDAALCIFGGNLEQQPEAFRARFAALLDRAGRRARFYGSYAAADLPALMREVDWVVVPSIWWENSPLVIQEAFAHGRPVICSDAGGMAEKVRDGVDGLQFRIGSAEALADRLTEALTEPDLWQRLHDARPTPPDVATAAAQHHALYGQLLAARRPPTAGAAPLGAAA
jgi:glycosyltransferase involved in cell wall biosynthesis